MGICPGVNLVKILLFISQLLYEKKILKWNAWTEREARVLIYPSESFQLNVVMILKWKKGEIYRSSYISLGGCDTLTSYGNKHLLVAQHVQTTPNINGFHGIRERVLYP